MSWLYIFMYMYMYVQCMYKLIHVHVHVYALQFSSAVCEQVWDLKVSKCVAVLKGHVSAVTAVGFSEDRTVMIR